MSKHTFSFWLTPAPGPAQAFKAIIDELAETYSAVKFDPHLTIFAGRHDPDEDLEAMGARALEGVRPFELEAVQYDYTDQLFKTLFITFANHPTLTQIKEHIASGLRERGDYELKPHLSLLYKLMPSEEKEQIIAQLTAAGKRFEGERILFDSVKLVMPKPDDDDFSDVEAWRVIKSWDL